MDDLDSELLGLVGGRPQVAQKTTGKRPMHGGKKMPKKRTFESDEEDELSSSSSEDDDFGQDFLSDISSIVTSDEEEEEAEDEDEDDEAYLNSLTMVERELHLSEKAQRVRQKEERRAIKQRLNDGTRKKKMKTRGKTESTKDKSLKEFKQRRERKLKGQANKLPEYHFNSDDDQVDYTDKIRQSYSSGERAQRLAPTLDQLQSIRVSRTQLEKWMFAPFFEETVCGCFLRLGVGVDPVTKKPVYRIAQIVAVVEYHRKYNVDKTPTKLALRLKHGKSEKIFLMDVVSNSDFSQSEYDRWVATMEAEKCRFQSELEIQRRASALDEAVNHVFTNAEIDLMLEQKRQVVGEQQNLVMQKVQWVAQRDEAQSAERFEDVKRLNNLIQQITVHMDDPDAAGMPFIADERMVSQIQQPIVQHHRKDVWAHLNEKNRKRNLVDGALAEQAVKKSREAQQQSGRGAGDPFARIKQSTNNRQSKRSSSPVKESTASDVRNIQSVVKDEPIAVVKVVHNVTDAFTEALQEVDIDVDI